MNHIAIFPGTFNPPTLGHLNIIERAAPLFETLIVGIGENVNKHSSTQFTIEERIEFLHEMTKQITNVKIIHFKGLTVDYAKKNSISVIIRGIRNLTDFENERSIALQNKKMGNIETLFLFANPQYQHISSSLIFEIAANHGDLTGLIPSFIQRKLK